MPKLFSEVLGADKVLKVRIPTDRRETGRPKGFAHVDFTSADVASQAVKEINGRDLQGRRINVKHAMRKGDLVASGPEPTRERAVTGSTPAGHFTKPGQLYPVNRERELQLLLSIAGHNWNSTTSACLKPVLAFTTQNFGSGKSFFGERAPWLMRDVIAEKGAVYKGLLNGTSTSQAALVPRYFKEAELKAFTEATVITIKLPLLTMKRVPSTVGFSVAMYRYIYSKATGTDFVNTDEVTPADDPEYLFDEIKRYNRAHNQQSNGHYIILFDEIGALEELVGGPVRNIAQIDYAISSAVPAPNQELKVAQIRAVYRVFLDAVETIISVPNVYIFAAGKSAHLGEYWVSGGDRLPLNLCMFVLEPFKSQHLQDILEKTKWSRAADGDGAAAPQIRSIAAEFQLLGNDNNVTGDRRSSGGLSMQTFCRILQDYTGGIPRYVQITLLLLWNRHFTFTTEAALVAALEELRPAFSTSIGSYGISRMSSQDMFVLMNLLRLYLVKGSLPKNYKIPWSDVQLRPLMSWIGSQPIFIKKDEKDETHVQFVFCKYQLDKNELSSKSIQEADESISSSTADLYGLFLELQSAVDRKRMSTGGVVSDGSWISKGRSLEILLANILIGRMLPFSTEDINTSKTFAECFDFLSETVLTTAVVPPCERSLPLYILPSIKTTKGIVSRKEADALIAVQKDGTRKLDEAEEKSLQAFLLAELKYQNEYAMLRRHWGVPCLRKSATSAGPDLILPVAVEDLPEHYDDDDEGGIRVSATKLVKLMFAAKNLHETVLTFSTIKDEVLKAFKYRAMDYAISADHSKDRMDAEDEDRAAAFRAPGVLVIAATRIGPEVASWLHMQEEKEEMNDDDVSSKRKTWKVLGSAAPGAGSAMMPEAGETETETSAVSVVQRQVNEIAELLPDGCQLVVLSEEGSKELLTERAFDLLQELNSTEDVQG